jgi:uncharacterized protein (DUF169 family)
MRMSNDLQVLLGLESPPVAIAFTDRAPDGVPRVASSAPASCGYWPLAASGKVFYTEPSDHVRCPIGAHTHGVSLTPEQAAELEGLVGTMVKLEYLDLAEVPKIPRRGGFRFAVYGPVGALPVPPDVVLVRGTARQLMLLAEASQAAGVAGEGPAMGRPTCAVLPQALASGCTAASFGCVGNRVYTGAADHEAYFAIPGAALARVVERLAVVARANAELEKFHRARLS